MKTNVEYAPHKAVYEELRDSAERAFSYYLSMGYHHVNLAAIVHEAIMEVLDTGVMPSANRNEFLEALTYKLKNDEALPTPEKGSQ